MKMNKYKVIIEIGNIIEEYIIEAPTKIKAYSKCLDQNKHLQYISQISSIKLYKNKTYLIDIEYTRIK